MKSLDNLTQYWVQSLTFKPASCSWLKGTWKCLAVVQQFGLNAGSVEHLPQSSDQCSCVFLQFNKRTALLGGSVGYILYNSVYYNLAFQLYIQCKNPSIHLLPFSSYPFAGVAAWAGTPSFPGHLLELLRKDWTVTPACPRSSLGTPPGGTAWNRHPGGIQEAPDTNAPLDVQWLHYELLPSIRAPHPISKGASSHCAEETLFIHLYHPSCYFIRNPTYLTRGEGSNVCVCVSSCLTHI